MASAEGLTIEIDVQTLNDSIRIRAENIELRAELALVNEHRRRAEQARERAALYAQATRWLRKRVLFLERALVAKHTPTVGVECELCGQPVDFGPMPLPVCGRCIAERQ